MSEDITFCMNDECTCMKCDRNPKHIRLWYKPHSYAFLEGTEYCEKKRKIKKIRKKKKF